MSVDNTLLFGRAWQVTLGAPGQPAFAQYGNVGSGTGTPVSALRVSFEVEKGVKSTPNKAKVTITNMNGQNRAAVGGGLVCTLSAGYLGAIQTLFVGIVDKATSKRTGADIDTELELLDGGAAIGQATISKSYAKGARLVDLLGDIAGAMQLKTAANPTGITAGCVAGIPNVVYSKGLTLHGSCAYELRMLCHPQGLEWSVQNGALQILPRGAATQETAEVLSPATGLLGVPSVNKQVCAFSALLNPNLAPGRAVKIESDGVNGFFKIRGGKWNGDSHGEKWGCELEAIPLPNAQEVLPAAVGFNYDPALDNLGDDALA